MKKGKKRESIFKELDEKKFFVYALLDPRKNGKYQYKNIDVCFPFEPFYIGKGQEKVNSRFLSHLNEAKKEFSKGNQCKLNKIRKIQNETGKNPVYMKIYYTNTEYDAFKKEMEFIISIGRKDKKMGPLTNLTDGGDGVSGYKFTEERKKLYSEKFSGENNPMYGKQLFGDDNGMYKKNHDDLTKQKIRDKRMGRYVGKNSVLTKKYIFTDPNNNEYISDDGFKKFCKEYNLGKMDRCLTGRKVKKGGLGKGWTVRYYNESSDVIDNKKLRFFLKNEQECIEIDDLKKCCKENNISIKTLYKSYNKNWKIKKGPLAGYYFIREIC